MPSITFRGAFLRHFDVRYDDDAKKFIRVHLTADLSDPVMDHMEWEQVPDCVPKCKLSGVINATHMILTPNGKELSQHELQIDINELRDFELVRTKDEEGEPNDEELRFMAITTQKGAGALLEAYIEVIGRGQAQLKVAHSKQEDLPLEQEKPAKPNGATLASMAEVDRAQQQDPQRAFQEASLDKARERATAKRGKSSSDEPTPPAAA